MVCAEDVIRVYRQLTAEGISIWLVGGWGIDALLGEQTRPHKDLDVLMQLDDVARMRELLGRDGYGLKELWSENRWVADAREAETATAFVLRDAAEREVDVHALRFDGHGNGVPAWEGEGLVFEREALSGVGRIARVEVRCITPDMQIACHTGYVLPEVQRRDVERLQQQFGVVRHAEPEA